MMMEKEKLQKRLEELGFNEQEVTVLTNFLPIADAANEGDAFARAQLKKIDRETKQGLKEIFEENSFNETAENIEKGISIMQSLTSFYSEEVEK